MPNKKRRKSSSTNKSPNFDRYTLQAFGDTFFATVYQVLVLVPPYAAVPLTICHKVWRDRMRQSFRVSSTAFKMEEIS